MINRLAGYSFQCNIIVRLINCCHGLHAIPAIMTYFKYIILLTGVACLALTISPCAGFDVEEVEDIYDLTAKVIGFVSKTWEVVDKVEERVSNEKTPLVWFTKTKERKILTNFGRITNLVKATTRDTDDLRSMMLGNLKKLQHMPNAMLNGIQVNELLESVRSIENDFNTMEGMHCTYYL